MSSTKIRYLAILDFEATCDQSDSEDTSDSNSTTSSLPLPSPWDVKLQEIIEIPIQLIDLQQQQRDAIFHHMVRPVAQPILSHFCTQLTSITQSEVEHQDEILSVIQKLDAWIQQHQLTADNTLVITCGDWDLRTMWPQQVSVQPQLTTPSIFQRWCNLKVIFKHYTRSPARGMMSMLAYAGIQHKGRHHRGIDDVYNLSELVLWALEQGWIFTPTWRKQHAYDEWKKYQRRIDKKKRHLAHAQRTYNRLPQSISAEIKLKHKQTIDTIQMEINRLACKQMVFARDHFPSYDEKSSM